ncbi:MAG: acetamidase/formamidase family protein [Myxococcales bacterium]|nr:acetamidase/formamidase family protein [Myxococcales bacterium]USN49845.1 MAG: acetamidase/formamidase family protein [Myxococcales bacterium]
MIQTLINIDLNKKGDEQPVPLHNRWHPDVPAVVEVKPNDHFRIECIDWTGGQIKNDDCADDVRDVELRKVHYLSGPIRVEGAKPGDVLVVDILDIGTFDHSPWGFTGIFAKENGGGFLTEHYPAAGKAIWDIRGIYASSRHVPGVQFAGIIHPGLIACAPSQDLLNKWNKRERDLIATDPNRVPALACPPDSFGAVAGKATNDQAQKIKAEGARTVPGREHGGNCDIKNLGKGSRLFLPVYVDGANLSVGDLHFSQGDGEITFCGAIEIAGWIHLGVDIIPDGVRKYGMLNPIFQTGIMGPSYQDYLVFEGISVDEKGRQHYLDPHVAYRMAALNAIEYLKKFGFTGEQAYMILSTAPIEGRISGIVDIPNACTTLAIPTSIFDFDIRPNNQVIKKIDRGQIALCREKK